MPSSAQRILYAGPLGNGQTCRDRMLALEDLEYRVAGFDTTTYLGAGPRWARSAAHRVNLGPRLARMNRELVKAAEEAGRFDLLWVDKGKWIFPETLRRIRKIRGARLLHFTPDAQLLLNKSRHFRQAIPEYDVLVTTKPYEVSGYRRLGAARVLLTGQAYDERRIASAAAESRFESQVAFIGHVEAHYRDLLARLGAERSIDLRVWGPGWTTRRNRARIPVAGPGLYGPAYIAALKSADIGLGLLSKWIPETSTTRTFEIPACGTMLLAERTEEHQAYFDEGTEAEFFDSVDELLDKSRFYLRNAAARRRISDHGARRCENSGYGNRARLNALVNAVDQVSTDFLDLRFGSIGSDTVPEQIRGAGCVDDAGKKLAWARGTLADDTR